MSNHICEDNLVMILRRLSVKTLLRCRSVCKEWKVLIDSPIFLQEHLSVQKPHFLIRHEEEDDEGEANYFSVDPYSTHPSIHRLRHPLIEGPELSFLGTLHGLVFLCDYPNNIFIWNPSTRKFSGHTLPPLPKTVDFSDVDKICFGFWMDISNNEFKFLNIFADERVKCALYSSIRNEWRVIPEDLENWKAEDRIPLLTKHGMAHWTGYIDDDLVILSFDFVRECFDFIEMPEQIDEPISLFHWQGTLSFVYGEMCEDLVALICAMYFRRESSWVKMLCREVCLDRTRVFWVLPSGNGFRLLCEDKCAIGDVQLVLYDTITECCFPLMLKIDDGDISVAFDFVESLLSP